MICATLFDFTGVIADDERGHFLEYSTMYNPTLFPCVVEFVNCAGAQYR